MLSKTTRKTQTRSSLTKARTTTIAMTARRTTAVEDSGSAAKPPQSHVQKDCVWNCCGVVNVLYWEIGRLDIQNGRFIFYSSFWLSNWVFPKKRKEAIHVFSSSFLQQKNEKTDYISLPDEISWSSTVLRSRCWFGECRRFWKPNSESFYQNWMIHPRDMIFQIFIHHFISVSTIKEQNELHWQ